MKNNRGFTLLEIFIVVAIMGIMATLTLAKFRKTVNQNKLEKAANNLYTEIRSLRSLSFKYDAIIFARITTTPSQQLKIYVDHNDDAMWEDGELLRVLDIPEPVTIGLSSTPPDTTPYESIGASTEDWDIQSDGLYDNWKDSISVVPDSRGEYNHGAVTLYIHDLPKVMYFIGITKSMQSVEFYKWEGFSWYKL